MWDLQAPVLVTAALWMDRTHRFGVLVLVQDSMRGVKDTETGHTVRDSHTDALTHAHSTLAILGLRFDIGPDKATPSDRPHRLPCGSDPQGQALWDAAQVRVNR